jgi:hypothetical protein
MYNFKNKWDRRDTTITIALDIIGFGLCSVLVGIELYELSSIFF